MLRGKQDVGEHGGLRRHRRDVHVERHLRVRLVETLHAGGAEAVVAPVADEHLDLIAAVLVVPVFLQDDVGKPARRLVGVDGLTVVVQEVFADAPVDSLHLGGLAGVTVAEVVVVGKACRRGRSASEHAALRLDGTDQAVERVRRHGAVHSADLHVRTWRLPRAACVTVLAELRGDLGDVLRLDAADVGRPLGGGVLERQVPPTHEAVALVVLELGLVDGLAGLEQVRLVVVVVGELVVPRSLLEVAHELLVPKSLRQNDVRNRAGQRTVGAGDDRQPLVGLRGGRRQARVDHVNLRAIHDLAPHARRPAGHAVRRDGVGRPHKEALRVGKVVVVVREGTFGRPVRHLLGFGADVAVTEVVRGAEQDVELLVEDVADTGGAALLEGELLRFAILLELHELVGDGIERLVPADRHKTRVDAAPLLGVGALHRGLDAVGVVDLLDREMRLRADFAARRRAIPIARDAEDTLVLRIHLHGAGGSAPLAGGCGPLAGLVRLVGLIGYGGKRRHPRRGHRSQPQGARLEE